MRNCRKLIIQSNDNPDFEGVWKKEDVMKEMCELDITGVNWLSYIFDHVFSDNAGFTQELQDQIINNDAVKNIQLQLHHGDALITLIDD